MNNSSDIIKAASISNDTELIMENTIFNSNYLSKKVKKLSSVEKLIILKSELEEVTFFPPNLKVLKIINCTLSNIEMESAPISLTKISLENNLLEFFIIGCNLINLVELDLSYNKLSEIPFITPSLKILNLEGNDIENINCNLKDSSLEDLNLGMNSIETFENVPTTIINLNISNNKFNNLDLSNLINLKKINASYNEINYILNAIPESVTTIDLSYNNLKSLPQFLSYDNIEYIDVQSNSNLKKSELELFKNLKTKVDAHNDIYDSVIDDNVVIDDSSLDSSLDSIDINIDTSDSSHNSHNSHNSHSRKSSDNKDNKDTKDTKDTKDNKDNKLDKIVLVSKIHINLKRSYEL